MQEFQETLSLTHEELRTVCAIFERLFPSDENSSGAQEIGAHRYLDRALAGAYERELNTYRLGLEAINRASISKFSQRFEDCNSSDQDALLTELEAGTLPDFVSPSQQSFFNVLVKHLREGLFSDPMYGGNKDKLGWQFMQFPGVHMTNTAEENLTDAAVTKGGKILSLSDIQDQLGKAALNPKPIPGFDPQASTRVPSSEADIVLCGFGGVGTMIAKIFADAGLKVVALEAGPWRQQSEFIPDELGIAFWTRASMGNVKFNKEVPRWRRNEHEATQEATFSLGRMVNAVGGSIQHYGAWLRRFHPHHYKPLTHLLEKYGKNALPEGCTLADWTISYQELEPYFERIEALVGVSGDASANPFIPQRKPFPMPPLRPYKLGNLFGDAATALGLHPFPVPAGANSLPYDGRPAAGYTTWANGMGPIDSARWSPTQKLVPETLATGNLELRTSCRVLKVLTNLEGKANGVMYLDANGQEHVQPAKTVILSSYTYENLRLLFLSGDNKRPNGLGNNTGQLGKHYMTKMFSDARGYFPDTVFNLHTGPCYQCVILDDYLSKDFDSLEHGFLGGATLSAENQATPIAMSNAVTPPEVSRWGASYKEHLRNWQHWGITRIQPDNLPNVANFVDLDPLHRDRSGYGQPVMRITFDLRENENRAAEFFEAKCLEILHQMGATKTWKGSRFSGVGSSHDLGGARMGDDPAITVVNRYLEVHDTPGLYVFGGAVFPSCPGINPTEAIWSLSMWAADQLVARLKS